MHDGCNAEIETEALEGVRKMESRSMDGRSNLCNLAVPEHDSAVQSKSGVTAADQANLRCAIRLGGAAAEAGGADITGQCGHSERGNLLRKGEDDTGFDDDGHVFSPKLREQRREVAQGYASLAALTSRSQEEVASLSTTALGHLHAGNVTEALGLFICTNLLCREIGFHGGEAESLSMAASCYSALGSVALATRMHHTAADLFSRMGDAESAAWAMANAAAEEARQGMLEKAARSQSRAIDIARSSESLPLQLLQLGRLGSLQLRQRQYGAARRTLAEALAIAIAIGGRPVPCILAHFVILGFDHRRHCCVSLLVSFS
uniref:Anaphase-promoting complex subunit 5 n=1 Tax=Chrysotila carterae TaxID=13221 RepID=A0A7S4EZV3_CHRCT